MFCTLYLNSEIHTTETAIYCKNTYSLAELSKFGFKFEYRRDHWEWVEGDELSWSRDRFANYEKFENVIPAIPT